MPHLFGNVEHLRFDAQMVGRKQDDRFTDVVGCFSVVLHDDFVLVVQFEFIFPDLDFFTALADAGPPLIPALFDQFDTVVTEVWFIQGGDVAGLRFFSSAHVFGGY